MRISIGRLRKTDIKKVQKSAQDKVQKQAQALTQLIDLPDFDVSQFIQSLLKNSHYEQILQKIPKQKQIDFFSKNYQSFLETQDQLLQLKLPNLQEIPPAKQFHLKQVNKAQEELISQEGTVMEIIDSFSSHVLEKNIPQAMRLHNMIVQMKKHTRYQEYFNDFLIAKLYREYYHTFIESCQDYKVLIQLGEVLSAVKVYLDKLNEKIIHQIQTNLNVDTQNQTICKQMYILITFIQRQIKTIKLQFHQQLTKLPQIDVYISKWISKLAHNFYQIVQPIIYQKEEISQILDAFGAIIETSKQAQSKSISLERQLKFLISADLPLHMQKVVEVVLQAFEDLLKDDNQLYEFVYFDNISSFGNSISQLNPIKMEDYGKKCSTQKAILLINSFLIILQPLCQQKWQFLQENTVSTLLDKISIALDQTQLHQWDYYHLFAFLERLAQGKIRHKKLKKGDISGGIKQKLQRTDKISKQCWESFQEKLTQSYFKDILSNIPKYLWNWRKYAESKQKNTLQPSSLSIELVVGIDKLFKQIEFRIGKIQFEYVAIKYFEYIIYALEYVLFNSYHKKGTNENVFMLKKKQQKIFFRAKQFPFEQVQQIKEGNILKLSYFTNYGLQKLIFQIYFLTDIYQHLTNKLEKIQCDNFINRIIQIYGKQQKQQPLTYNRNNFKQSLQKFIEIYKNKPQTFTNYLNDKSKKVGQKSMTESK